MRREGKRIAGIGKDGKHYIEGIAEDDSQFASDRNVFWMQFQIGQYQAWLNVVTFEVSETEPSVSADDDVLEGSIVAEEMGKPIVITLSQHLLNISLQDSARQSRFSLWSD